MKSEVIKRYLTAKKPQKLVLKPEVDAIEKISELDGQWNHHIKFDGKTYKIKFIIY